MNYGANNSSDLAYAGAPLNSYYTVWAGQDNRNGQTSSENEVFGQAIEPTLTLSKTILSATSAVDAGDKVRYQIVVSHKQVVEGASTYDVSLRRCLQSAHHRHTAHGTAHANPDQRSEE